MVKKTLEAYECDVCGLEGERYVVIFPEGSLALDRCENHNGVLLKLRDEKGTWTHTTPGGKTPFKLSSMDEIERQRKAKKKP